jgi:hypothetical protein
MQQADRDRLRAAAAQRRYQVVDRRVAERLEHRPVGCHSLSHLQTACSIDQRQRLIEQQVVDVELLLTRDFHDVLEPARRHQRCRRPLALDQRVGDQRRGMQQYGYILGPSFAHAQRAFDAV